MRTPASCCLTSDPEWVCWRDFLYVLTSNGRIVTSVRPRSSHQAENELQARA